MDVKFTDYLKCRAQLRGFDLDKIEEILKYSTERYLDMVTNRKVVVGRHDNTLILIPYEIEGDLFVPVTVHTTTRQQVKFRIKAGRFVYE